MGNGFFVLRANRPMINAMAAIANTGSAAVIQLQGMPATARTSTHAKYKAVEATGAIRSDMIGRTPNARTSK